MRKPKIGDSYYYISINDDGIQVFDEFVEKDHSYTDIDWKIGNCYPNKKFAKAVMREIKVLMKKRSREA